MKLFYMNFRFIGPTWQFSSKGPSGRKFWAIDQATDGVTHTHTRTEPEGQPCMTGCETPSTPWDHSQS